MPERLRWRRLQTSIWTKGTALKILLSTILSSFSAQSFDEKMNGLATLKANRSSDCQEKIFDILKNNTENNRLRNFFDDTTEGRVFIALSPQFSTRQLI